jgi:putative intracellular protease/amidase
MRVGATANAEPGSEPARACATRTLAKAAVAAALVVALALGLGLGLGRSSSSSSSSSSSAATSTTVLMLVANEGFFFQEYFDPRTEIEAAGLTVAVASGLGGGAVPHPGSYHAHKNASNDFAPGVVPAAEVDRALTGTLVAADLGSAAYAGLVVVGGWGASRYYHAYPGAYDLAQWAPVSAQATEANRLIGAFLADGKPVLGVCNGVNVLAWARVGGVSPLNGRTISAPWGSAPPQQYPDPYPSGPLTAFGSSWTVDGACPATPTSNCFPMDKFALDNGATVEDFGTRAAPLGAMRDEAVSVDDEQVVTAQDNFAARHAGKLFAELVCSDTQC